MRQRKPPTGPWPPEWARLPNLDHIDDLERGEQPPPEPTGPHDTRTAARCLFPFAPVASLTNNQTADPANPEQDANSGPAVALSVAPAGQKTTETEGKSAC